MYMSENNCNRDIDRGWAWIVLISVYLGRVILSTSLYMSGIFYLTVLDYFHGDITKTTFIGSLNSGLMCLCGPFVSKIVETSSCRTCMVMGGILVTISYFTSAFVSSVNQLILTMGILGGIGNSMASLPFSITLGYYFQKRRNTVISLSMAVIGLGMFIASPFSLYLIHTYGLKGTFMIMGAFNAQICVCGVICAPSRGENRAKLQKQMDKQCKERNNPEKVICFTRASVCNLLSKFVNIELIKNVPFLLFLLSTTTWNLMQSVCLIHLPNYIVGKGFPESAITIIMTIFGVSNTLGRFLSALTVGSAGLDSLTMHVGMLGVAGLVTLTFPLYSHLEMAGYIYAAFAGFYTGGPNSVMTPITLRLVGVKDIASAHGLEIFFCGIGIVAGPPIAGIMYEVSNSYENSFMMSGLVVLTGSVLGILSSIKARSADQYEVENVLPQDQNDQTEQNNDILESDGSIPNEETEEQLKLHPHKNGI